LLAFSRILCLVLEYKVRFLEWVRHIPMLYPSAHNMVHGFIRGLSLPLHLVLEHLIAAGSLLCQVVDHMRATERACIERLCHQYTAIGIPSMSEDTFGGGRLYF